MIVFKLSSVFTIKVSTQFIALKTFHYSVRQFFAHKVKSDYSLVLMLLMILIDQSSFFYIFSITWQWYFCYLLLVDQTLDFKFLKPYFIQVDFDNSVKFLNIILVVFQISFLELNIFPI